MSSQKGLLGVPSKRDVTNSLGDPPILRIPAQISQGGWLVEEDGSQGHPSCLALTTAPSTRSIQLSGGRAEEANRRLEVEMYNLPSTEITGMRGSSAPQWSFSNMASQLVSFKSAQERGASLRSYPTHLPQRTSPLDKQGGSQYPVTSHHRHQDDLPPINHHSDGRVFPGSLQSNQTTYLPGNASNLVTSTMTNASGGPTVNGPPASGPIVGSTDLRSSPSISTGPCQLTIFYNGSVCVYDHVSPEKAQAIMLLAGNGDSTKPSGLPISLSSTPNVQPLLSKMPPTETVILTQPTILRQLPTDTSIPNQAPIQKHPSNNTGITNYQAPALRAQASDTVIENEPPSTRLVVKDTSVSGEAGRYSTSLAPIIQSPIVASTSTSEVSSVKPTVVTAQAKSSEPSKAVTAGGSSVKSALSAVPQARKASITRFLEKRKERVVGVSPYPLSKNASECNTFGVRSTFAMNFISSKKQLDTGAT